jgi:hypothetical protein
MKAFSLEGGFYKTREGLFGVKVSEGGGLIRGKLSRFETKAFMKTKRDDFCLPPTPLVDSYFWGVGTPNLPPPKKENLFTLL